MKTNTFVIFFVSETIYVHHSLLLPLSPILNKDFFLNAFSLLTSRVCAGSTIRDQEMALWLQVHSHGSSSFDTKYPKRLTIQVELQ